MIYAETNFRPVSRLEERLTNWGQSQALDLETSAPAVHAIARAMQFGRKNKVPRGPLTRTGQAISLLTGSPAWGRTTIPCHETRSVSAHSPAILSDSAIIEAAVQELARRKPDLAEALRLRYCASGTPSGKARKMGLTLEKYRDAVAAGRAWVGWRINA